MQTQRISIEVAPAAAQAYAQASVAERQRIALLLNYALRVPHDMAADQRASEQLKQTLLQISQQAEARGATEDIINQLLDE